MAETEKKRRKKPGEPRMPTEADLDRHALQAVRQVFHIMPRSPNNPDITRYDIKRDEVRQIMGEVLYWYNYSIPKNDQECAERIIEFFQHVAETGEIATWEKFCLAMGTTRDVVNLWERGELGRERSDMIKKAKQILAGMDANLVAQKLIPEITYIFRSKNFYDMKDKTETVLIPGQQIETADMEQLKQKYITGAIDDEGQK